MEVAIGASISGVRAMASMKHVGVNVASDPLYTASYTGVGGGLVLVAAVLIYSQFAADSVLDFMSRTVIMMLFASALNIILGFGGLRPLGMATYFGMGSYAYVLLCVRGGLDKTIAIIGGDCYFHGDFPVYQCAVLKGE